ncbi:hypothetical protein PT7_2415 [Pusillimonas sp. T7-7]|uniref:Bug family tripartite tricarboxylate transporter substrate binding protein n=1 Tax=Pusillimonas sp. (strain T7-7) TaxID=1007105 RepID=UPI000208463A|nr:tripartite tricarboxylate transporter substrate binding protein [Pusillimonas sp. T7-7]AEC20955.1 hypothetical protein PT7_2415 [Pusillimonas sp. T7-7]
MKSATQHNFRRLASVAALSATMMVAAVSTAHAAWPDDQPIRMIIPYAPGGATDTLGRIISKSLSDSLKQTVIVENRPGAGSMIGSEYVVRAAPDGYTLVLGSISNVLNAFFYKKPLYDILTDLKPVGQVVSVPNFLGVHKDVPAKSVQELIALAKEKPGELSCAVSGVGSSPHLSCELFKALAGIDLITTPFKGGAPAIQSTMGGQTTMFFANEARPYIEAGQVRGLGVTTPKRSEYSPELPAIAEQLPGYDVTAWYGVWAPIDTPDEIVNRLSDELNKSLKDPQVLNVLASLGASPTQSDPEKFTSYIKSEYERWKGITAKMNVQQQ